MSNITWKNKNRTNDFFVIYSKCGREYKDLIMIEAILLSDRDISAVDICEIVEDIEFGNWRKGNASKRWHRQWRSILPAVWRLTNDNLFRTCVIRQKAASYMFEHFQTKESRT